MSELSMGSGTGVEKEDQLPYLEAFFFSRDYISSSLLFSS